MFAGLETFKCQRLGCTSCPHKVEPAVTFTCKYQTSFVEDVIKRRRNRIQSYARTNSVEKLLRAGCVATTANECFSFHQICIGKTDFIDVVRIIQISITRAAPAIMLFRCELIEEVSGIHVTWSVIHFAFLFPAADIGNGMRIARITLHCVSETWCNRKETPT